MKYHLTRQGRKLGEFSKEELRRRREAGELDGTEYVWGEGMAQWESLDTLLAQVRETGSSPPPIPGQRSRNATIWATLLGVSLAIAGAVIFGLRVWNAVRHVQVARGRSEASTVASKPVLSAAKGVTQADVQKRARSFRDRQWLDGYQERGQRNTSCDAEALRFIQVWLAAEYGGEPQTNAPAPSELADRIAAAADCSDPLVLTLASSTGIEVHELVRRLELAMNRFESSKHRAYPRFYAAVSLANQLGDNDLRVPALDRKAVPLFKAAFSDGSFLPEDQAELGEFMVAGWGESFFNRNGAAICQIVRNAGKDYAWLALALEGEYHINEAWRARGTGYAKSVTEKGWQVFSGHLAEARVGFTDAWQFRPDLPLAPCRMMTVAQGESGIEEMRQWFDRAISAQIDYPAAWSKLRWGLRPRWHGSLDSMLALGITAVNTRRFDTDVPRKIMDVVRDLEAEQGLKTGDHIYGRREIWPHVQAMYEGYLAEPSQASKRNVWRAEYAVVAYLAGQYDIAGKQLQALNWELPPAKLSGWGADLSLLTLEVAARTGASGGLIATAEENYRRGKAPLALDQFKQLARQAQSDGRTSSFVRARVAILEFENRLQSGAWVDFVPREGFDLIWAQIYGKSTLARDGALEVESGKDGHMLFCRARVGPEFEVRGEFEVVRTSNKSFQAGLVIGNPDPRSDEWYGFRMKRNDVEGKIVGFSTGWSAPRFARTSTLKDDRNSFVFNFQNGTVTASLNGEEVLRGVRMSDPIELDNPQIHVGIGAFHDTNQTVIRYRNLQIRKLMLQTTAAR